MGDRINMSEKNGKELLRKNGWLFLLPVFLLFIVFLIWHEDRDVRTCPIMINEVCSNNFSIISDGEGNYFDYIELYNNSEQEMALDGLFLSDSLKDLQRKDLSGLTIGGKSFLLIGAVGEEMNGAPDQADFRLGSGGDTLYLSNTDKKIVDSIILPKLQYNQVFARAEDGSGNWQVMSATPMKSNAEGEAISILVEESIPAPVLSVEGGFYESNFSVELELDKKTQWYINWFHAGELYYTLDGSMPTRDSCVYKGQGIPVKEGVTTLRARYIGEDGMAGAASAATYFVGQDVYKDDYVVSLMVDKEDLYGEENGICAEGTAYREWEESGSQGDAPERNFEKHGREWEREGNVELFTPLGNINQAAGIRLQGNRARRESKKRFTVTARDIYAGDYYFPVSLYGGKRLHSFYLRPGFANAVYPDLVRDRAVATQECYPASLYLNGELYYRAYLAEKFNEDFFAQTYGVDRKNVIIMSGGTLKGKPSDQAYFDELIVALNEDLSSEQAYEAVKEKMDVQSYIDFLCISIYLSNLDVGDEKNVRLWRTREIEDSEYGDGRWRWVLYDLDDCDMEHLDFYGIENMAELNTFSVNRLYTGNAYNESFMYVQLKQNEEFRRQFVLSFMDLVNNNFSEKAVEEVLSQHGETMEHRDGFFLKRKSYIVPYLAEEFGLQGSLEKLTIQTGQGESGGYVQVNTTIPDLSSGSWQGEYFTDYPVTLTAICEEGYRFAGWSGDRTDTSETIEVTLPAGGVTVRPVFEKIPEKDGN